MRITRTHEFDAGHRVTGHEGQCRRLHGHRYEIAFTCESEQGELDGIGRVIDFAVIKTVLCKWLDDHFDHRFLLWDHDPMQAELVRHEPASIVLVPFNPTAENIAQYLLTVIGPQQLDGTGVRLVHVKVNETRKCSAEVAL